MYKVEIHPPGTSLLSNGLPTFELQYRNDDGGAEYGKDSFLVFEAPADGTYQVRTSDAHGGFGPLFSYHLNVRPPNPDFSVALNPKAPIVWKNGAVPVAVNISRRDEFDGPVRIRLEGLPTGFQASESVIESGQNSTSLALSSAANTVKPTSAIRVVGQAMIGGREVIHEAIGEIPKLADPGDLETRTSARSLVIKPGHESRFTVEIDRRGQFAGRVPVEVRGLPHGVRVLNIGLNGILITERETRREIILFSEAWVKPMERPIVVLARSEAKNTEHAASPLLLKVEK